MMFLLNDEYCFVRNEVQNPNQIGKQNQKLFLLLWQTSKWQKYFTFANGYENRFAI